MQAPLIPPGPQAPSTDVAPGQPGLTEGRKRRRGATTMEYLVTMTTHVPAGTSEEAVEAVRTREAARSRELAAQGHLLGL